MPYGLQEVSTPLAPPSAEELSNDFEQFAYIVSHDFNAPFRHIREFSNLLIQRLGDKLDNKEKEFFSVIDQSVRQSEAMISALLEYSRLDTRAHAFSEVSCEKVFSNVKNTLQHVVERTKAKITHDPLPTLLGDEVQLHQLFYHLLDNAMKFARENVAPVIHISVASSDDDNAWIFRVSDNGIGIAPEYYEKIFGLFKRLSPGDPANGIGAGLTLCKKIVQRHGGRIWCESSPMQGTSFSFSIPKLIS